MQYVVEIRDDMVWVGMPIAGMRTPFFDAFGNLRLLLPTEVVRPWLVSLRRGSQVRRRREVTPPVAELDLARTAHTALERLLMPLRDFSAHSVRGAVLLLVSTVAAFAIAHSPLGPAWSGLWERPVGLSIAGWEHRASLPLDQRRPHGPVRLRGGPRDQA